MILFRRRLCSGDEMNDVTHILNAIEQGDQRAAEQLLPLVYDELRKLAADKMLQENPGQTLQATALVHEAYVRMVDVDKAQKWNSRAHFFGAAAEAMRRILVENARRKGRQKRGGDWQRHDVQLIEATLDHPDSDILAIDEALTQLSREHTEHAELVRLRYFAGLTLDEAAIALSISSATADRRWRYARAWLVRRLNRDADS